MSLKSLLFTISRNKALDRYSHEKTKYKVHQALIKRALNKYDNIDIYNEIELTALLFKAIERLPENYKTSFIMSCVKGKTPTDDRMQTYQKLIRDYLRCVAAVDQNIGRLLDYLDEAGLAENSIVIYVADQGCFFGEHGMSDKRMMLEESLRMPFVIRYPKEIPAGTRNDDIIMNIDYASLLADYTEIETPALSQGRSFRENLKGNTPKDWRESMYYRYWTQEEIRPAHFGVRNHRYKLIFLYGIHHNPLNTETPSSKPTWEFYDLEKDPKELKNLYNEPQYRDEIKALKLELVRLRHQYGDTDENSNKIQKLLQQEGLIKTAL